MKDILSSAAFLLPVLGGFKAIFVAMFGLNLGVILTWVDRRMRGMIQDCIGPNRAAVPLPGVLAAALALAPALIASGALVGLFVQLREHANAEAGWGMVFVQSATLIIWVFAATMARIVAKRGAANGFEEIFEGGSARAISAGGLMVHLAIFAVAAMVSGTANEEALVVFMFDGGVFLLVFALLVSAGYVAINLQSEKVVRLTAFGLLHPIADGLKTAFKADFAPKNGDKLLYNLAPWIAFFPGLTLAAVIPFGPALCFGNSPDGTIDFLAFQGVESAGAACSAARFSLQVADLDAGILFYFAMAGTGIVGAAVAGWASDNKFSLLGGMRAASQMISYEVTLGLTVIGALMVYGSVRIEEMVLWQAENAWGIFVQPIGFVLFLAAAIAETKRAPFDIPEGESEIVAGYFTEYAGMKFTLFFFSEYIAIVSSSALMAALFFGGWHLPFFTADGIHVIVDGKTLFEQTISPGVLALIGVLAFIGKVIGLCFLQQFIRWTLPRFRYDQLMSLGWRKLLPASLANVMLTAVLILAIQEAGPKLTGLVTLAGELSMLSLTAGGSLAAGALVVFLLIPGKKQRLVVSTSARYTEAMGGTREAKMEA